MFVLNWGQGDSSVDKVSALRTQNLNLIPRTYIKIQTWWHTLIIPPLEAWSQVDPWGSLAIQSSLLGKL